MNIVDDECGQGAAEYILLFGGIIVIAIAALFVYQSYFKTGSGLDSEEDLSAVRNSMKERV